MQKALNDLKEYLSSRSSEDAKRPLAYSFFKSLFGRNFKVESDAQGSDGYVEGQLLVELKTQNEDWLEGLYQGLHYQKLGLSFPNICVISYKFIGLWKIDRLPKQTLDLADGSDSQIPPNKMGRINANKTTKVEALKILGTSIYLLTKDDLGLLVKDFDAQITGFNYALHHLDKARIQINLKNFIDYIYLLQKFFANPLDAIHCFYAIVGYWGIASKIVEQGATGRLLVGSGYNTNDVVELGYDTRNDHLYLPPLCESKAGEERSQRQRQTAISL